MLRVVAAILFIFFTSHASAKSCPEFYRFVDFRLEGNDGVIYRGGTILCAEGFNGEALLLTEQTECLEVIGLSKDGFGNPIPIVTRINYDPEQTGIKLTKLRVMFSGDPKAAADKNTSIHHTRLEEPDTVSTRGENFLCASSKNADTLSCQLFSPFPGNVALVTYCDALQCMMPVLVVNEQMVVSAVWESNQSFLDDPGNAGPTLSEKVQKIHDFLKTISASLWI